MKVVILCGGLGTRLKEETESRPKPMVEVGGKPILWHIMKIFAYYGHQDFILCLGYKGEIIKEYFLNYGRFNNDFSIDLGTGNIQMHNHHDENNWKITLVDTGLYAMTGARVKRIEKYIEEDDFLLTYGDGVTDLNVNDLVDFHRIQGAIGTVTVVSPPSSFGDLKITGDRVASFQEKPDARNSLINGGYFVFKKQFFQYLPDIEGSVLEQEPMVSLVEDGQLAAYRHQGYWRCMDTNKDLLELNTEWETGRARWGVWL